MQVQLTPSLPLERKVRGKLYSRSRRKAAGRILAKGEEGKESGEIRLPFFPFLWPFFSFDILCWTFTWSSIVSVFTAVN
jgi:hypothetical protein